MAKKPRAILSPQAGLPTGNTSAVNISTVSRDPIQTSNLADIIKAAQARIAALSSAVQELQTIDQRRQQLIDMLAGA